MSAQKAFQQLATVLPRRQVGVCCARQGIFSIRYGTGSSRRGYQSTTRHRVADAQRSNRRHPSVSSDMSVARLEGAGRRHYEPGTKLILLASGFVAAGVASTILGYQATDQVYCSPKDVVPPMWDALGEADRFYFSDYSREKVLQYVRKTSNSDPGSVNLRWRLARALYDVALEQDKNEKEKKSLLSEAFEVISGIAEKGENNFDVNVWYGTILNELGKFQSTRSAMANTYVIRNHFLRAVEINPTDPTARYLLGEWCYSIANLSWMTKKKAFVSFSSPPESSFEEALDHFLLAEELSPGFRKKNAFMIGQCYLRMKKNTEARMWFQRALSMQTKTREDKEVEEEAQKALSKIR